MQKQLLKQLQIIKMQKLIAELSKDLGEAMVGINEQEIEILMAERGK